MFTGAQSNCENITTFRLKKAVIHDQFLMSSMQAYISQTKMSMNLINERTLCACSYMESVGPFALPSYVPKYLLPTTYMQMTCEFQ